MVATKCSVDNVQRLAGIAVISIVASLYIAQVSVGVDGQDEPPSTRELNGTIVTLPDKEEKADSELKRLWYARTILDKAVESMLTDLPYARELAEKSTNATKMASGDDSPEYAQCIAQLGVIDMHLYRFAEAVDELQKAKSIVQLHKNDLTAANVSAIDFNLAWATRKTGDLKKAERLYNDILKDFHTNSRLRDARYPILLLSISSLYLDLNDFDTALNYINDARDAYRKLSVDDDLQNAHINSNLARYYFGKKLFPESNKHFQQAIVDFQKSKHNDVLNYVEVVNAYSRSLLDQANYDEAASVLTIKSTMDVCLGHDHPLLQEIRQRRGSVDQLRKNSAN